MSKNLAALLALCECESGESFRDLPVAGICYDSRQAQQDFLFVAIKGQHTDGHHHIQDAINRGAMAVIFDHEVTIRQPGIAYIRVKDSRRALSILSAAFHDFPADKLKLIGVTGTDGKSSTVWFIHQLLTGCEIAAGFLSTIQYMSGGAVQPNPYRQSTPEALEINSILNTMVVNGLETAVLEATSHGLSRKTGRLADISFSSAVLTNISHEHLEFHGTFEQYKSDKANLFRQLRRDRNAFGVVNINDSQYEYFAEAAAAPVFTYGLENSRADMQAVIKEAAITHSVFKLTYAGYEYTTRLNIAGSYNVENLLAALLTVHRLHGIGLQTLVPLVPGITAPPGRLFSVEMGQPFTVIVDYAHTPNAFENLFRLIRPLTSEKLISVFGSAGERDIIKRPLQGRIASQYSDIVILTDEDPRAEDPRKILGEISAGCSGLEQGKTLFLIPDRKEAIRYALNIASEGDTVLLLGKGHETSIIYADRAVAWNEIEVCRELLSGMLFNRK